MNKSRRKFLKTACNASLAAGLAPMLAPKEVFAATDPGFTDYKALVYIVLEGGNDAFNMVLPLERSADPLNPYSDNPRSYDSFLASRGGTLAVADADFRSNLNDKVVGDKLSFATGNPYVSGSDTVQSYRSGFYRTDAGVAVNALMPELAHMMNQGNVATVASVGTLFEPLRGPGNETLGMQKPGFLGSHNTQRRMMEIGQSDALYQFGWVGRLFDEWGYVNGTEDVVAPNISFGGNAHALIGRSNAPLVLRTRPSGYSVNIGQGERDVRTAISAQATPKPFGNLYSRMVGRSFGLGDKLVDIWANAHTFSATNAYGGELFSIPARETLDSGYHLKGQFFSQLQAVLKMIEYGKKNGFNRQVFYVKFEGFDTHSAGTAGSSERLREISMGLYDFQNALKELEDSGLAGLSESVTTFTTSDFGRSVRSNGDGTDHAWAGHNLIIGNAVKGGLYGEFPDWTKGGKQDSRRNGTIIPTIAIEQQYATLTKWFGVTDALNEQIFGNLTKFIDTDTDEGRDLGFMKPA